MREFANLQDDARVDGVGLQAGWLQRRAAEICLALAFSPALAWMCPFGVDEQTFLARLGYWAGILSFWFVAMAVVESLLAENGIFRTRSPAAQRSLVIGLAALPMMIITGAATHALTGWQATPLKVLELYWQIIVLGSAVALLAKALLPWGTELAQDEQQELALQELALPQPAPAEVRHQPPATVPLTAIAAPMAPAPLMARLPLALRGRIVCLEMEDHYVRVHTDRGSALVLLRLSDAIAETHPVPGRQVHRSWWVSDEAVEGFERVGRVGVLRLSNGSRAPVSQRYLRAVEAAFS